MKIIFSLILFALLVDAQSQSLTVSGIIRDKHSGRGLDSSYVILVNKSYPTQRDTFYANSTDIFRFY